MSSKGVAKAWDTAFSTRVAPSPSPIPIEEMPPRSITARRSA